MDQDDAELVGRSQRGDLTAFNLIVERYQSLVYNLAARILGDRTAAEDVAQETFISAYKAISRFRGGSLRAWLSRIASNLSSCERTTTSSAARDATGSTGPAPTSRQSKSSSIGSRPETHEMDELARGRPRTSRGMMTARVAIRASSSVSARAPRAASLSVTAWIARAEAIRRATRFRRV